MKTMKYFLLIGILFTITASYTNSQTVNPEEKSSVTTKTKGSSKGCYEECYWVCIQWYPNKKDCRRSRKICYWVCDAPCPKAKTSSIQDTVLTASPVQVQVSGKLGYILAISKDLTHWNLRLDKPLRILGQEINDIEVVFSKPEEFTVDKKDVKITGTIEWCQTQTKGRYPIIKVSSMEISTK